MVTTRKVRTTASGPTIVLIHAFPFSSEMWERTITQVKTDCTIVLVDLPGFGSAPVREHWTMHEAASSLYDELTRKGHTKFVLGGLSMGGYQALAFYAAYPDVVSALVLSDTKAAADTEEAKAGRETFALDALKRGAVAATERMLDKMTSAATKQSKPQVHTRIEQWMLAANPNAIAAALRAMAARADSSELLPLINIPALLIVGSDDKITPGDEMKKMSAQLKNATFVEIDGAAHMSSVEKPEEWAAALDNFLSTL